MPFAYLSFTLMRIHFLYIDGAFVNHTLAYLYTRGAATGEGTGGGYVPPTLKSRGTSYVLVPLPLLPQNLC